MTKQELVQLIMDRTRATKLEAQSLGKEIFTIIKDELIETGSTNVPELGSLKIIQKAERNGRNPKTGESLIIPAKKVVKFKAKTILKEAVNK